MSHHISVDPSIIVQSSLALVMAITITDVVKASVEHAGNALYHRFIAMIIVIVLIMIFAIRMHKPKHSGSVSSVNSVAPALSTSVSSSS